MSSQADSFEQKSETYLTCFIKKVIEVIESKFQNEINLQHIKTTLQKGLDETNDNSQKRVVDIIINLFIPEYKSYSQELKEWAILNHLRTEYPCNNELLKKVLGSLQELKILVLSQKTDTNPYKNPDDVGGYAVKIARLFQVMAEANFLDFDPRDEWGQAFMLLAGNQCKSSQEISKTASSWKREFYEKCRPLKSIASDENRCLLEQTAHTLGFDPAEWDKDDFLSDNELKEYVDAYKKIYLAKKNLDLDFSSFSEYLPKKKLTEDEKELLEKLKKELLPNFFKSKEFDDKLKPILDNHPSDKFLLELLELFYRHGYYQEANTFILDKIVSPKILQDTEFNLLKAHIYGSLGKYVEAWKILDNLEIDDANKLVDIKTSTVSNLIRNYLREASYNSTLHYRNLTVTIDNRLKIQKRTFEKFVNFYKELFEKSRHYYPGINYAYMHSMYHIAYTDVTSDNIVSEINNIYEMAKESIVSDKCNKKNAYYATISEIEFFALMDNDENVEKCFKNLPQTKPTTDMLYRTLRQIKLYLDFLKHDHDSSIPSAMRLLEEKLKNTIESSTNR